MSRVIQGRQLATYNNTLFAYLTMLRQFSAAYVDSTLYSLCLDLEAIKEQLSTVTQIDVETLPNVIKALGTLELSVVNLQITILNNGYKEINPVCGALSEFFLSVRKDLEEVSQ